MRNLIRCLRIAHAAFKLARCYHPHATPFISVDDTIGRGLWHYHISIANPALEEGADTRFFRNWNRDTGFRAMTEGGEANRALLYHRRES